MRSPLSGVSRLTDAPDTALPWARVVLRRCLIAAALAALVVSTASAAPSTHGGSQALAITNEQLMPGVGYQRQVDFTPRGPVILNIVTAPRPDGALYTLAPVLGQEKIPGGETLTAIENRLAATATVVGVDGDYFNGKTGVPAGVLMRGGVLDKPPNPGRSSLGIAGDGTLSVARIAYKGTWQGSGQRRALDLDLAPVRGHATLYTPAYGAATPRESGVVEAVFSSFPATQANRPLTATVTEVTTAGATPIPAGGAVLVARGAQAADLTTEAPVGRSVEVRLTLTPDWSAMTSALGGGPLLVSGGKPVFDAMESFGASIVNNRYARSAVGQLSDGRILLVTVEGGNPAYSIGMTSYELAVAMARLGSVTAVGLGYGAPATMAFDGTLLTKPPGGVERPVADALVLSYAGVYAAPLPTQVLSPNGDGVGDTQTFSYKLVRPSHVVAAVIGPNGASRTLASDDEQPGVQTLTWDGTNADGTTAPEGSWRFTVAATDDTGRTTSAVRDFSLDDTLSSLAVAHTAGSTTASATFVLSRPATVVATVERRNGIVVATVLKGSLAAGPQTLVWDGQTVSGKVAPSNGYQVHVVATSAVGVSGLTVPFTFP